MCQENIDFVVIGAGVTGLSVARELALAGHQVVILEKNTKWGQGVSGRNSEVLHAGIYYPPESLKARLCVAGNSLLREYLQQRGIPLSGLGKLIVGWEPWHVDALEKIVANAKNNGVPLTTLAPREVRELEPNIHVSAALFSPTSAVFDVATYLHSLYREMENAGGMGFMNVEVTGLTPSHGAWEITGREGTDEFALRAGVVINCVGLYADAIASMAGVPIYEKHLNLHFCKGDYFSITPQKARLVSRPVYPLPEIDNLGIHITPDFCGSVKLGPDAYYIDKTEEYSVDPQKAEVFYQAVKPFFLPLEPEDILPAMSGIRPKLQENGGPFKDFHIKQDLPGLYSLIGIESPSLTSSLAIARHLHSLL
ncbi:NAD(P)/FAD-dependent oxidoreductase [Myxococcota bacterium]|nr:NAD(P)/FAD-dependent oxidoreductase [Myxococcota bacterium]